MREIPDLLHITENTLPTVLLPRLMAYHSSHTGDKKTIFTEAEIPRVSFAPTVYNCFSAIFPLISEYMQSKEGLKKGIFFNVYKAVISSNNKILTPEELTKKRYVWDAYATQEHWLLDPVNVRWCGAVKIDYDPKPDWIDLYPYNDQQDEKPNGGIPPPEAIKIKQVTKLRGPKYAIRLYPNS